MTDYISVGKLQKPHGIHGAFHFTLYYTPVQSPDAFFIETGGTLLPYFIQHMDHHTIQFEEVGSREAAKALVNAELQIPGSEFEKCFVAETDYSYLSEYELWSDQKKLGRIEEVTKAGLQWLLRLTVNNNELLLPLADELIEELNHEKKQLHYRMPDGLL